jgi:hypothetical protein
MAISCDQTVMLGSAARRLLRLTACARLACHATVTVWHSADFQKLAKHADNGGRSNGCMCIGNWESGPASLAVPLGPLRLFLLLPSSDPKPVVSLL